MFLLPRTRMPDQAAPDMGVAAIIAELMYLRQHGHPLSADDAALLDILDTLDRCERDVKASVSLGQLSIESTFDGHSEHLPDSLADTIRHWMEAQSMWETAVSSLSNRHRQTSKRSGPRGNIAPATSIRIPTSNAATRALISIINTKHWTEHPSDEQLVTRDPTDGLRVNLSNPIGFDARAAISHLTSHGASVVQTFLTLASIWREQAGDASYDTYVEVFASDILRHQGRQQTPRGGYHQNDTLSKGRDVFILSRLLIPVDDSETGGGTKLSSWKRKFRREHRRVMYGFASTSGSHFSIGCRCWIGVPGKSQESCFSTTLSARSTTSSLVSVSRTLPGSAAMKGIPLRWFHYGKC